MQYTDPYLTIPEQIAHLQKKGLQVDDDQLLADALQRIGYFRLNQYMKYFVDENVFEPQTSIQIITELYDWDHYLRSTIFEAIETIEVALRATINDVMGADHGAHWYMDSALFGSEYQGFHSLWIEGLEDYCNNHPEELFIRRYKMKYTDPALPPSWMMMETTSLGTISKIFQAINLPQKKSAIANVFRMHDRILVSWFRSLTYVRNLCAHHAKILDRTLTIKPIVPSRKNNVFLAEYAVVEDAKIYAVLCCMQYMLRHIKPSSFFREEILAMRHDFPFDLSAMGFTPSWFNENIWVSA